MCAARGAGNTQAMPTRLETLELLVSRAPADPFPYYGLALEYRSANRDEDALRVFAQLRERFPDYVPQYLMAGQLLQRSARVAEARAVFEAGIAAARSKRDGHALGELESALAALP